MNNVPLTPRVCMVTVSEKNVNEAERGGYTSRATPHMEVVRGAVLWIGKPLSIQQYSPRMS